MHSLHVIFVAEMAGTFGLLVAAAGSIVYDASLGFSLGPVFIAAMHFLGLFLLIVIFGKYSMAHFNPAVTVGFVISGYLRPRLVPLYLIAQSTGAMLGVLFVRYVIGDYADLGLNAPNSAYTLPQIYGAEIAATVFLMGGILLVINVKRNPLVVSTVVGGIVALDVFFLGHISGASMNPIRSIAPAVMTGIYDDLWLYCTAPFLGSFLSSMIFARIFASQKCTNNND